MMKDVVIVVILMAIGLGFFWYGTSKNVWEAGNSITTENKE